MTDIRTTKTAFKPRKGNGSYDCGETIKAFHGPHYIYMTKYGFKKLYLMSKGSQSVLLFLIRQ